MGKRLLTAEYAKIVLKGLLLPERDVFKYYTNITEKHYPDNPEMFTELKNAVNEWIEWYKGQVRGGVVPSIMQDGTIKHFDRNQTFEADEGEVDSTKYIKHDLYEDQIWLLPLLSERNVRVNKAFFENHIKIIDVFFAAKTTFISFWEVLTETFCPHIVPFISTKKTEIEYSFIKGCTNDQYENVLNNWEENQTKSINDLIKEFYYTEFEQWSNVSPRPEKLLILNEAITLFKKEQIIHTLKYDDENSLGSRFIDSRIRYLEIIKSELEQKLNTIPEIPNEITDQENNIDLSGLISRVKFDKNNETKSKVQEYLDQLCENECFIKANAKEFTAVALIFFQTGWIINTKTFSEWLSVFSKAFAREKSTYKMNQMKTSSEAMKRKIPFLDGLPKKQKIQSS